MKPTKRKQLEERGWVVGNTQAFLGLTDEEAALVELKLDLARWVRSTRLKSGRSQQALAKMIESSQSRVAKMEAGDRSVSIELILRALLAMGTTRRQLARMIDRVA